MSNLAEALLQLREALEEGQEPEAAAREAASDFGLNVVLLERKWVEQHHKDPASWQQDYQKRRESIEAMKAASVRVAQTKATELAAKWLIPAPRQHMVGRIFKLGRHEYAFAVFAADNPKWGIRAVRVLDGRIVNFSADRWKEIEAQLRQTIRVRRRAA